MYLHKKLWYVAYFFNVFIWVWFQALLVTWYDFGTIFWKWLHINGVIFSYMVGILHKWNHLGLVSLSEDSFFLPEGQHHYHLFSNCLIIMCGWNQKSMTGTKRHRKLWVTVLQSFIVSLVSLTNKTGIFLI